MIQLLPMTQPEFDPWLAQSIIDYAADKVAAGAWPAGEAEDLSRADFNRLLPAGLASPNNYVYSIWSDDAPLDAPVGVLWIAVQPRQPTQAFIFDFIIFEPYRRRGYGAQGYWAGRSALCALLFLTHRWNYSEPQHG